MANQKKTVQFDHFHPYYLAQDENGASREHLYDLRAENGRRRAAGNRL